MARFGAAQALFLAQRNNHAEVVAVLERVSEVLQNSSDSGLPGSPTKKTTAATANSRACVIL